MASDRVNVEVMRNKLYREALCGQSIGQDHDSRIRVRRYAGESCLPECVIERPRSLKTVVIIWGAISYHGPLNLLRIEGNLNTNRKGQLNVIDCCVKRFGAMLHQFQLVSTSSRHKSSDLDTEDKEREKRPEMFEDTKLETLLPENSSQTLK
ncbi:hypothetical protein TNCV_388951 [Trichonephila clavipes]|nr:hypothetical protein TNCV_388951 [Trichonephila clavipes]